MRKRIRNVKNLENNKSVVVEGIDMPKHYEKIVYEIINIYDDSY